MHSEKELKIESLLNVIDKREKISNARPKFKSIISVNSEHGSSDMGGSIIIGQLPQELVSSRPIKSLLWVLVLIFLSLYYFSNFQYFLLYWFLKDCDNRFVEDKYKKAFVNVNKWVKIKRKYKK